MTYSTLLLDADETLLDFAAAEKKALFLTMQSLGYSISKEEHRLYSEINDAQWKKLERGETTKPVLTVERFSLFLSELGIVADAKEVNRQYTDNLSLGSDLIDGAMDFLEIVKEHFSLYMITNGTAHVQIKRLAAARIDRFFSETFISEAIGFAKPKKEYFTYVLSHIEEQNPKKVLVIGDSLTSDIAGGQNAGLDTCWFNRYNKKCTLPMPPTMEAKNYTELLKLLGISY